MTQKLVLEPLVTERQWQATLISAFHTFGYLVNHIYPLQTKHGWRTGSTVKGWPDLEAVGRGFVIYVEVKKNNGYLSPEQEAVLKHLSQADGTKCWVLRPRDDWQEISNWIAYPARAPKTFNISKTLPE